MNLSNEQQGEVYSLGSALIWSAFPVVTILSLSHLPPLISLAGSVFFAMIFFASIITFKHNWSFTKNHGALKDILLTTLFIGVVYYGLYFWGLQYTSAGNAAIIMQMQVFFTYLLFNVWQHEYIRPQYIIGAILMCIGAIIISFPADFNINIGDIFILLGAMATPIGNHFQKKARARVRAEEILVIRNAITCVFILLLSSLLSQTSTPSALYSSFPLLIINGFIMFGISKIFFIEAIHRISVTKSIALTSVGPLFTLGWAYLFLGDIPTSQQIIAFFPICIGVILLTHKKKALNRKY